MQLNLTKAQLKEIIDATFTAVKAAAGAHPLAVLVIGTVQEIADGEIDNIAAAFGITQ